MRIIDNPPTHEQHSLDVYSSILLVGTYAIHALLDLRPQHTQPRYYQSFGHFRSQLTQTCTTLSCLERGLACMASYNYFNNSVRVVFGTSNHY